MASEDTILVVTQSQETRRRGPEEMRVGELAVNIQVFVEQMNEVLEKTPEKLGRFQFTEFEVYAEVSARGTLALLGTGGEAGASGGLKFVFKRVPGSE